MPSPARRRSPFTTCPGLLVAVALAGVAAVGCGGPAEPAGRIEVAPTEATLPYPGRATLTVTAVPTAEVEDAIVFAHLIDTEGDLLRTFDHAYPGDWTPGGEVEYPLELWQSALAPPLPAGRYRLTVGVYTADGRRHPLAVDAPEADDAEYLMATVEAPPPPVGGPRLHFDPSWEPGSMSDRQTLGARWLGDGGTFVVGDLDGPLDIDLVVRVPSPDQMPYTLVLDPGAAGPAVEISSPCLAEPVRLEGAGFHEPTLRLVPEAGSADCDVRFEPDFVYLDTATLRRVSVELRRLLWTPPPTSPPVP